MEFILGTDSKKEQKRFQNGNAALEKYLAGVYDIEKGGHIYDFL
jgi:hypothetical protein